MKLNFNSDMQTVSNSLMKTLSEIDKNGETPILKAEMLFKYARVKFLDKQFDEAHKIFGQCNVALIDNQLPENKEIYYWVGRISEAKGEIEKARTIYTMCLEKARFIDDHEFVDEKLDRINTIETKR